LLKRVPEFHDPFVNRYITDVVVESVSPFTITVFPSALIAVDCPKPGILYAVRGVSEYNSPSLHVVFVLYMIGVILLPEISDPHTITVRPSALIAVDQPKFLIE
jgi:hypothetical protein